MVTKEQRRGTRQDMEELREYAIQYYHAEQKGLPRGLVGIKFGWGYSKIHNLMKMCGEAFDDLQYIAGTLFFLGPYETYEGDKNDN